MDKLSKKISSTLKTLRQEHGWSLDMASKKTGVSKAMLGQIERGESSPTIATLWKIVTGFNVSFSTFVDAPSSDARAQIHHDSDFNQIHPQDDKILIMPVFAYDKILKFEMFIIELLPGCEHLSASHQKGVIEHVVMVSGEAEILVDGKWRTLKEKEGIRFNADQAHGYRNRSKVSAILHNVIHYSTLSS
ncbi:MAG TPA: helix-turn-helix domain-containing protein [Gammaproteobacteria bacterium]|nr:helix-turn-helix domain-containing protein [Gammaproteobacteria bacterium]